MARSTEQRVAVERVIREAAGPMTAADIHAAASALCSGLGIATVYRTLNLLETEGQIRPVQLPYGERRYELAREGSRQYLVCSTCGEVSAFERVLVGLPEETTLPGGFVVQSHILTVYGECLTCRSDPRTKR